MARRGFSGRNLNLRRVAASAARRSDWAIGISSTAFTNVPAASTLLLAAVADSTLAASGITPATLIRTRGMYSIKSDQNAAGEVQIGAIGLAVVDERARAAGVGSLATPITNMISDEWYYINGFAYEVSLNSAVGFDSNSAHMVEVDSRAMRKIDDGQAMVVVVENAGATGFDIAIYLRTMFKRA